MGCSGSNLERDTDSSVGDNEVANEKLEKLLKSKKPIDLLMAYLYLERNISEVENVSPPAVYGEALSRLQQIKLLLQIALEEQSHNELNVEECSFQELFVDLGLKDSKTAAEHEEFVAKINKMALNKNAIRIWQKAHDIVEDLILKSSIRIKLLQDAYYYQEKLMTKIFGKPYQNETEKMLEKEIDRMRYYKDILYIGILQWEACIERITNAYRLIEEGFQAWTCIENQPLERKIEFTVTARDCFHEAILLIQSSEELLIDVKFPYCTTRELRGVSQALEYVLTDILIIERYLHATEIYKNLLQRAALLDAWMKEILNSKMKKDFLEINENITDLSKRLKNERIELIKKKLNLKDSLPQSEEKVPFRVTEIENLEEATKPTSSERKRSNHSVSEEILKFPINLESKFDLISPLGSQKATDIMNHFHSLVESKKMTMWPSRRIDELQNLFAKQ